MVLIGQKSNLPPSKRKFCYQQDFDLNCIIISSLGLIWVLALYSLDLSASIMVWRYPLWDLFCRYVDILLVLFVWRTLTNNRTKESVPQIVVEPIGRKSQEYRQHCPQSTIASGVTSESEVLVVNATWHGSPPEQRRKVCPVVQVSEHVLIFVCAHWSLWHPSHTSKGVAGPGSERLCL